MSALSPAPCVLVVDDDEVMLDSCRRILERKGFVVETEIDGLRGRQRALQGQFDLVLLDVRMPQIDGLDLLSDLRAQRADPK